jgi:hypothetical protein
MHTNADLVYLTKPVRPAQILVNNIKRKIHLENSFITHKKRIQQITTRLVSPIKTTLIDKLPEDSKTKL